MPELPLHLNSLDVKADKYQAGRSLPGALLFLREDQVQYNGGNTTGCNAR
ncbi:hypothetical protein SAMN06273570_1867 [Candidatus Pantoea floridensis]|uniref:Uncharacterized protein n=1 Tax=Candidatus Pantoea floridensis TaxID=1938870 RepID=A0A286BTN9_9GAMM|nr:hypothetical protein BX596_3545 [Enterobacteriaceae bacterium JKS000233]SOD37507.1 hypothetical protein SAMN06273570_1867 [Pantoea floridensis]